MSTAARGVFTAALGSGAARFRGGVFAATRFRGGALIGSIHFLLGYTGIVHSLTAWVHSQLSIGLAFSCVFPAAFGIGVEYPVGVWVEVVGSNRSSQ